MKTGHRWADSSTPERTFHTGQTTCPITFSSHRLRFQNHLLLTGNISFVQLKGIRDLWKLARPAPSRSSQLTFASNERLLIRTGGELHACEGQGSTDRSRTLSVRDFFSPPSGGPHQSSCCEGTRKISTPDTLVFALLKVKPPNSLALLPVPTGFYLFRSGRAGSFVWTASCV